MRQDGHGADGTTTRNEGNPDGRLDTVLERPSDGALPLGIFVDQDRSNPLKGNSRHPFAGLERPRHAFLILTVVGEAVQERVRGNPPVEGGRVNAEQVAGKVDRHFGQRLRLELSAGGDRQLMESRQGLGSHRHPASGVGGRMSRFGR